MTATLFAHNLEMIEYLVDTAGANPNLVCMEQSHRMGWSLLDLAQQIDECQHIVIFLKQHGGDDSADGAGHADKKKGYTSFHLRPEVSSLMEEADRLSRDVRGLTDMLFVDEEHPVIIAYRQNAFVVGLSRFFGLFQFQKFVAACVWKEIPARKKPG